VRTLQYFIDAARVLLLDTKLPYRYDEAELRLALDLALDEAFRIRPDIFIRNEVENIMVADLTYEIPIPRGYTSPFIYYIVGHAQLRDDEDVQDARASAMLGKFTSQLLATAS
jgi:hypothetical protein